MLWHVVRFALEPFTLKGILTAIHPVLTCGILPADASQGEKDFFRRIAHMCKFYVWCILHLKAHVVWLTIEGLRTKKVKKHKRVLSRKVKKHIFHIFQYGHFCFQRTYQGNVWRRKPKFAESVLFYLSCPEPFNYFVHVHDKINSMFHRLHQEWKVRMKCKGE